MRTIRALSRYVSAPLLVVFVSSLAPRPALADQPPPETERAPGHAGAEAPELASAPLASARAPLTTSEPSASVAAPQSDARMAPLAVVATGEPTEKSGVSASAISPPQGAGKVQGMGESFSAQLSTGIATLSVPVNVPPGRGGIQPGLSFAYSSSAGHGAAGLGWSLGSRFIARQTDRGTPGYVDPPSGQGWSPSQDRFVTGDNAELVPICLVGPDGGCAGALPDEAMPSWAPGWQYFRAANETDFTRYFWSPDRRTWRAQTKSGGSQEYGVALDGVGDSGALESDPAVPTHVSRWNLAREYDAHGAVNGAPGSTPQPVNVARYRYLQSGGQSYLADVFDTPPAAGSDASPLSTWAHHVHLAYESRPDPTTSYRRGYAVVDGLRLTHIDVTSQTFGADPSSPRELVRRYRLTYDPAYHVSLFTRLQLEGRCAAAIGEDSGGLLPEATGCPAIPAMTFAYGHVNGTAPADLPGYEAFDETPHAMGASPTVTVDAQRADFLDVNADGLPDVLVTDPSTYGSQLGVFFQGLSGDADAFTSATAGVNGVLNGSSASLRYSSPTFVPLDLDGNGTADLLQMPRAKTYAVYTPTLAGSGWVFQGKVVATADAQSPLIDFNASARTTRTLDVNGDGILDVVVSTGGAYETFFGLARYPGGEGQFGTAQRTSGTTSSISTQQPATFCAPWSSMPLNLGDVNQKTGDMNGDGLPDIVRVRSGEVRYWPGRGNGFWGTGRSDDCPKGTIASSRDVAMSASPAFAGAVGPTMRIRDLNGDGLDDLVQIRQDAIDVWLNVDGTGFTARPHTIKTSAIQPNLQANARLRFEDVNGSGTTDVVWGEGWHYQYVDLSGGQRPWLLTGFANGLGKTTDLEYSSSTAMMLAARKGGSPWGSTIPNPVHVLAKVTERDHLATLGRAQGEYVREYTYRDPVYDGRQREFRGFRGVHAVERGDAGSPTAITDSTFLLGECAPDPGDPGPSPCTPEGMWRPNPREATKGLTSLTEKQDEAGRYLSTDHTTYRLRRLYGGLDGRDVRHAFAAQTDHFLYDTAAFTPSASTVVLDDLELELGGAPAPVSATVTTRAAYAHTRSEAAIDRFGNVSITTDDGCVEGCASADESIVTAQIAARPAGDASGWLWRLAESSTGGSAHPGQTYHHTRSAYDAAGDVVSTEAELSGSLPLDRRHEDPSKAVAPSPPQASEDGWIVTSLVQHDPFGNVTGTRAPGGRCHAMAFDPAYAQLALRETVNVGMAGSDGCGTISLVAIGAYDRGLAVPTMSVDPYGAMTTATYDGLGRIVEIRKPDPSQTGLVDPYPSQRYEYVLPADPGATPWTAVHLTTHDAPSEGVEAYTETWTFTDGMGRRVGELHTADPSAGDAAPWIAEGVTEYDRRGSTRKAQRAWFYGGDPLAFPLQTAAPAVRFSETRYDAFGRSLAQYALDGAQVGRTDYHALSTDALSALDLLPGADPVPSTTIRDGHGRSVEVIERLHVPGSKEAHTTISSFLPTGEPEIVARATDSGAPPVVRWMRYDSLGRRVLNVEPDTATGPSLAPGADPTKIHAWRYAYDDDGDLVGTSDARGCGANYAYDAAGRLVGEDYSPCLVAHAPYTPVTPEGAGFEVSYRYDSAPPDAPAGFAGGFAAGRLVAISDRASESLSSYDAAGRVVAAWRRLSAPEGSGYTARWYTKALQLDTLDRPSRESTGAASPELMGSDGASVIETAYSRAGRVGTVGGSYGALATRIVHDAAGLVQSYALGDVASTATAFAYDARDRATHAETRRAAPAIWGASPAAYSPAPTPGAAPSTFPLLLEYDDTTYDALDRPVAIHDGRDPAEWPAGARPADRAMQYDDLGRLTNVSYAYAGGADPWVSPTAAEESRAGGAGPVTLPRVTFDARPAWQTYAYDWLGNVARSGDDAAGFFDRSLGVASHGTAAAGPYRLLGASIDPATPRGGSLAVAFDDAGDQTGMVLRRSGSCLPAGTSCSQRFAYDWDEVGRLVRARRWDLSDPGSASDPLPGAVPAADLRYTYDSADLRVLKAATDASGATRHTAYVFSTLELRQTTFEQGEYRRDATTEVAPLIAHGVRLGEVAYQPDDVPTVSRGHAHVFLGLTDRLASIGAVIDKDTAELVEQSTYLPYGAKESDYRPARWDAFRDPYGFSGKEEDEEVGLTYFGRRFLAPALLRWTSPDPLAIHGLGADPNVYAYVHGRVFVAVDPSGLEEVDAAAPPSDASASVSRDDTSEIDYRYSHNLDDNYQPKEHVTSFNLELAPRGSSPGDDLDAIEHAGPGGLLAMSLHLIFGGSSEKLGQAAALGDSAFNIFSVGVHSTVLINRATSAPSAVEAAPGAPVSVEQTQSAPKQVESPDLDKITARASWRAGTRESLHEAQGGKCEWCAQPVPAGKGNIDHVLKTYAERAAEVKAQYQLTGKAPERSWFIELYHTDLRLTCEDCNKSHWFEGVDPRWWRGASAN